MKTSIAALLLFISLLSVLQAETDDPLPEPHFALITGGGSSIKGFGETDQIVYTADVMWRYAKPLFSVDKKWIKGTHHMWIETPVSILIHDSDSNDTFDLGIIGVNFLAVWVFPEWKGMSPYLLAGGGPRYIIADIEGMGSDMSGNYQLGAGAFLFNESDHPLSLEIRYDHISNGDRADPNVPLNSVKILLGIRL